MSTKVYPANQFGAELEPCTGRAIPPLRKALKAEHGVTHVLLHSINNDFTWAVMMRAEDGYAEGYRSFARTQAQREKLCAVQQAWLATNSAAIIRVGLDKKRDGLYRVEGGYLWRQSELGILEAVLQKSWAHTIEYALNNPGYA